MRRIRIVGACFVAMFVLGAATAASASAMVEPTYKVCAKVSPGSGKWNNATCTVESKGGREEGRYELAEWNKGKTTAFKGTYGTTRFSAYIKGLGEVNNIVCAKGKLAGKVSGPSTSETVITFEKCGSSGETCASPGAKAGDIVTNTIVGTLLVLANEHLGIKLEGAGGGNLAVYKCGAEEFAVAGSLSGEVDGAGSISKDSSDVFSVNGQGEPIFQEDGALVVTVTGVGVFEEGWETTSHLKGEAMESEV